LELIQCGRKVYKKINMKSIFALSMLLFMSCKKIFRDDILSIPQTPYNGSQLRIDGFYYRETENNPYIIVYLFYRNGTLISAGGFPKPLEKVEEGLRAPDINNVKNAKYNYGRFLIEADSIQFERWYPGSPPLPAYIRAGRILNDTTFVITESFRMQNGKKTETDSGRNEVYHFRQFSPKPDSTNRFVP